MNYFYGGAFNPMTKAHLQIINQIVKEMIKDDVLIIGITNHDYKTYQFPFDFRKEILLKNLNNQFGEQTRIKIVQQNQRTWKYLTENTLVSSIRPLTLVLGEDEYNDLKALNIWHYSKEILETFPIKVFSRSNETKDISATKVRQLMNQHADRFMIKKYITKVTMDLICK